MRRILRFLHQLSFGKFVALFAVTGVVVPLTLLIISQIVGSTGRYDAAWEILKVMLVLWPAGIMLMAVENNEFFSIAVFIGLIFAFSTNALFYSIIGSAVWYGLHRRRWVLYVTLAFFAIVVSLSSNLAYEYW